MIITIAGKAGSGKSTIAKLLAKKLKLKHYSMGDLTRKKAQEHHMTLSEFNKYEETHPEIDKEIDEMQRTLGKKEDNFVIDGRTGFHFIPHSIKIFLDVKDETAAKRIFGDKRDGEKSQCIKDLIKMLKERKASEQKRYKQLYNIDNYKMDNYDFVIDTSDMTPDEVLEQVLKKIKLFN